MIKRYIFIHNFREGLIKVISHSTITRLVHGWDTDTHRVNFYEIFFSKHKGLICNCPFKVYKKQGDPTYCAHIRTLIELKQDAKIIPRTLLQ